MLDADDWWLAELGVSGAATSKPASVATRGASTSLARRRRSFHTGSLRARGRVLDRRRADQPRDCQRLVIAEATAERHVATIVG
ncbi:MAG: hypothetical protein JO352_07680 [Chloroflexi bacterium]|nr:hypothetical protein [Chloroflexota bacterium]